MQEFADPDAAYPIMSSDGTPNKGTVFLRSVIEHPKFEVGAYTYASAFVPPKDWAACLAPYLFEFSPERLVIGKFCQIADGVTFITASANHRYDGVSSYPFAIFGGGPLEGRPSLPDPGPDTIVGNDVWLGKGATLLPGAQVGHGAIIGAGAVVQGNVPDYTIAAGNPARIVRERFTREDAARLVAVAWWDWSIEKILAHESVIMASDVAALEAVQHKN